MRMEVHLQQRLEQRMHLSQQMLQNLELLQLPIMELREHILEELQENPTLEEKGDVEEAEAPAEEPEAAGPTEEETAKQEALQDFEEQWSEAEQRTRRSDSSEAAERRMEMLNNVCRESASLREHLLNQISILEMDDETREFCQHVVENIEDSGLLKFSLEEMIGSLPEGLRAAEPEVLLKKMERAVAIVQSLEPRGVGARSIKECLLLQLSETDPFYPLLRKLIESHFEDVGANRLPKIVKAFLADPETLALLGYSGEPDPDLVLDDLKILIKKMGDLNPRPGSAYGADVVPKVYPEVVIKNVDGKYEIMLEDGWLPPISVNRSYEEMLKDRKLTASERAEVGRMTAGDRFSKEERELLSELARGKRIMPGDKEKIGALLKTGKLSDGETRLFGELVQERKFNREEREYLKQKMDAGRKLISAIEQRRSTIHRITSEILKHQMDFFEVGIEHLRPLKMQEVADAVGIHLSTVSRAISEKWVETPRGIFPLKFFFASAAPKGDAAPTVFGALAPAADGPDAPDEQTRMALMEKIREIIDGEDRKNPLSDLEIVRILKDRHRITAARRTIAKYREELNIPSSRLRKQF